MLCNVIDWENDDETMDLRAASSPSLATSGGGKGWRLQPNWGISPNPIKFHLTFIFPGFRISSHGCRRPRCYPKC